MKRQIHRTGGAGQLARAASRVTFAAKRLLCARFKFALVAQLDRASDFESEGRRFESVRARQEKSKTYVRNSDRLFPRKSTWEADGKQAKNLGISCLKSANSRALVCRRIGRLLCRDGAGRMLAIVDSRISQDHFTDRMSLR